MAALEIVEAVAKLAGRQRTLEFQDHVLGVGNDGDWPPLGDIFHHAGKMRSRYMRPHRVSQKAERRLTRTARSACSSSSIDER